MWNFLRDSWYKINSLRFLPHYVYGYLFHLSGNIYKTEGFVFAIPTEFISIPHRTRFYKDTHEKDERELGKKHIKPGATVLEIGAGIGIVSCFINRCLSDKAQQVSVEANPALIETIELNRDQNNAAFGIEHCLVSRQEEGTFGVDNCIFISSAEDDKTNRVTVPVKTVEQIEEQHGLSFDTVFMDIQGGEYGFFRENPALLAKCTMVILEFHPHLIGADKCDECRQIMKNNGLQLAEKRGLTEVWSKN